MILYVNRRNEVKDVNSTTDNTLTPLVVSDEFNPFASWSYAKICCYKVDVKEGIVTMFTPYVPYHVIEQLDKLDKNNQTLSGEVTDTQLAVTETYEKTVENESYITELELALTEIYEMLE